MEPHAAQDRLSFVCNWKHMHREAKSKARAAATDSPLATPPLSFPPGVWGCHILAQAKWQVALHRSRLFTEHADLAVACQIQFSGTTVSRVVQTFRGFGGETWVAVGSLLKEAGFDIESDMQWEHRRPCTGHSPRSALSGEERLWMQGRAITLSYVTTFSTRAKIA